MPHLPDHQTDHDPLLIAAFASGDAEGADLERARDLVARCDDCAALHHDLRAVAAAMPALPAAVRSRDFRLTPEQADSLRPAGWRRLLAPLAGPRFAFAAPLGGSLAALGIAGILVAGAAGMPLASGGARDRYVAAQPPAATDDPSFTAVELTGPSPAPVAPQVRPAPSSAIPAAGQGNAQYEPYASSPPHDTSATSAAPDGEDGRTSADGSVKSAGGDQGTGSTTSGGEGDPLVDANDPSLVTGSTDSPTPLQVIATIVLVVGVLLVGSRWVARRAA